MAIPATPNQWGKEFPIYYAQRGNCIVLLLCGGDKSTQGSDISKAHQPAADWLSNEDDHDR